MLIKKTTHKPCPDCGTDIRLRSNYCKSCAAKGARNGFFGKKHHSDVMKAAGAKSGKSRTGVRRLGTWSKEARERHSKKLRGQRHSPNTEFKKGGVSPNYQGGITPLNRWIRTTDKSKEWTRTVLERDNFTCKECGLQGVPLEAHHVRRFSYILRDFLTCYSQFSPLEDKEILVRLSDSYAPFFDLDNGVTLCAVCHAKTKGRVLCS
jgi:predicted RNA-binding Zn-ribbon protein involved in translation (DUF1610 family)